MIHDAQVEVTCDGEHCRESVYIELDYVYHDYSGNSGQYDDDDSKIEEKLQDDEGWVVVDGKHYCCNECAGLGEA